MTVEFEDPIRDKSNYADLFLELHNPENWGAWVVVDTVSGGGLASRLRADGYRGMRDLDFEVTTKSVTDGLRVLVKVTGRKERG